VNSDVGSTESPKSEGAGFAGAGAGPRVGPNEVEERAESTEVEPEAEPEGGAAVDVEALAQERDEYLDALQRLKAEFDNYRKRVAREEAVLAARASERLVRELLPVLDDLERALDAASDQSPRFGGGKADASATERLRQAHAAEAAKLEDGVRLVYRSLAEALAREGLAEISTDGKFDPHTQEALLSQPSNEEEGTVVQVLQKGYTLGDRVLRPARVVVSSGGERT
jgi:molecular chaperone GrpE